jgi:crotonobetainyl-CoA:carnitine CoA-transferase CaiB-like acyl-CoA transferase
VDPPDWDEPAVVVDMTLGKRAARLDARTIAGRDRLHELLATADVLVHGYREGALDHLGLDANERRQLRPGLVDVSLTAYGHTGPWAGRRGFDSLVQMSSGIAELGMRDAGASAPTPLPVQGLDHATGWLMGAAVVRGLASRVRDEHGYVARLSLARTAVELERVRTMPKVEASAGVSEPPVSIETPWGAALLLAPPFALLPGPDFAFDRMPSSLGSAPPDWP